MTANASPITQVEDELRRKQQDLAALQAEVEGLRNAAELLRAIPSGFTVEDLELAARALRRLSPSHESSDEQRSVNGFFPEKPAPLKKDLAGKTIIESVVQLLTEHRRAMHYRELARESLARGYTSGRRGSDKKRVETSFGQTLRRIAGEGGEVRRAGEGRYQLREKIEADEE